MNDLEKSINKLSNYQLVVTNGCFDILHVGHIKLFQEIRERFPLSFILVGIDSDENVKSLKGKDRPINNQEDRAKIIESICFVDFVHIFDGPNLNFLKQVKPQVYFKGGDYSENTLNKEELDFLKNINCQIYFSQYVENKSTTSIINKITGK